MVEGQCFTRTGSIPGRDHRGLSPGTQLVDLALRLQKVKCPGMYGRLGAGWEHRLSAGGLFLYADAEARSGWRGHFRDSARLVLAELFMDVISDELALRLVNKLGQKYTAGAFRAAKQYIVRRYGSEIQLSFLNV